MPSMPNTLWKVALLLLPGSAALAQAPKPSPVPSYYPTAAPPMATGPFVISSTDGKSFLRVGGLLQSDFHFFSERGRTGNSAFFLRRVRPTLEGSFAGKLDFRLMPEFGEGRAALLDAFLDLRVRPHLRLRSGKFKVPYSLERLQAAGDVAFVERALTNNLIPVRDVGLMLMKEPTHEGDLEWELGLFNGGGDSTSLDNNGDNSFDIVGRVFWQPQPGHGVGIAATSGSATESLGSMVFRSAGRSPFFRYSDGVSGNGQRSRLAPQFFWYSGSLGFLGEQVITWQTIRNAASTVSHGEKNSGFTLQTSYVLTGEKASFRNVVPSRPYDFETGRGGAWELVARYSEVQQDSTTFSVGLADPALSAQKVQALTFGANWYWSRQTKLQLNYETTDFGRTIRFATGVRRHEKVVLGRLQLQF